MNRNILSQRRCRFIILLVLVLLTMEGASAQRVQPVQSDQKPKPAISTESATKSFFGAVIDEDEDLVRRLLQQNPALVSVNNEHGTALHFAIGHNRFWQSCSLRMPIRMRRMNRGRRRCTLPQRRILPEAQNFY